MNRPRFADLRASRLAQSVGLCQQDIPSLAALVNEATEKLLMDPMQPDEGWWGTWVRAVFNLSRQEPTFVQPRNVARVILMDVCKRPTRVQNGFYEFLDFGRGLQPSGCPTNIPAPNGLPYPPCNQALQAYDREFSPILGTLASTPQIVRIFPTDPRDVGKVVLVQGTDQNGLTVLGTDPVTGATISGEFVTINTPFVDTTFHFATITGLQKDATFGPVNFYQVDPVSAATLPLSIMEPSEVSAAYRRYFVNGLPNNCCNVPNAQVQVTAMCKLDFVPVVSDPDYLGIPNVPALIRECESIRYSSMDTAVAFKLRESKHAEALSLLFGQLDAMLGKERPAITVPIFGSDRMYPQPM